MTEEQAEAEKKAKEEAEAKAKEEAEAKAKEEAEAKAKAEADAKAKEETLNKTIATIKEGYEEKLAKQKAESDKAIKERDDVIKQLLTGGEDTAKKPLSIVDKINQKRQFKKW